MDTADHLRDASPWRAEADPKVLAILGKTVEETGELIAALGRCIIQGVAGAHPVTGKPNADWLFEEVSDALNMTDFLRAYLYDLHNPTTLEARRERKRAHISQWLQSICDHRNGTFRANAGATVWSCCGKPV